MASFKLEQTILSELPEWFLDFPGGAAILNVCTNYQMLIKEIRGKCGILVIYLTNDGKVNTSLFKGSVLDNEINVYNHFCAESDKIILIVNLETKTLLQLTKQLIPLKL